mmetsp:Transcript_68829/g.178765  ORF Transcript_68829/g.178765 Transcript_68829/m.178765 type:complete len:220 (-) Transcript_68829:37-696(-)
MLTHTSQILARVLEKKTVTTTRRRRSPANNWRRCQRRRSLGTTCPLLPRIWRQQPSPFPRLSGGALCLSRTFRGWHMKRTSSQLVEGWRLAPKLGSPVTRKGIRNALDLLSSKTMTVPRQPSTLAARVSSFSMTSRAIHGTSGPPAPAERLPPRHPRAPGEGAEERVVASRRRREASARSGRSARMDMLVSLLTTQLPHEAVFNLWALLPLGLSVPAIP